MAGVPETLKGRSFTRVASWSRDELETLLGLADELKTERARRRELRVLPGPRCLAWEQAENRLHTQKALMALVIR